jgi:hypothetical protein
MRLLLLQQRKTIDIYSQVRSMQVWFSEPQKENRYCFIVSDSTTIQADTLKLRMDFRTILNLDESTALLPGPVITLS